MFFRCHLENIRETIKVCTKYSDSATRQYFREEFTFTLPSVKPTSHHFRSTDTESSETPIFFPLKTHFTNEGEKQFK